MLGLRMKAHPLLSHHPQRMQRLTIFTTIEITKTLHPMLARTVEAVVAQAQWNPKLQNRYLTRH